MTDFRIFNGYIHITELREHHVIESSPFINHELLKALKENGIILPYQFLEIDIIEKKRLSLLNPIRNSPDNIEIVQGNKITFEKLYEPSKYDIFQNTQLEPVAFLLEYKNDINRLDYFLSIYDYRLSEEDKIILSTLVTENNRAFYIMHYTGHSEISERFSGYKDRYVLKPTFSPIEGYSISAFSRNNKADRVFPGDLSRLFVSAIQYGGELIIRPLESKSEIRKELGANEKLLKDKIVEQSIKSVKLIRLFNTPKIKKSKVESVFKNIIKTKPVSSKKSYLRIKLKDQND